MTPHDIARMVTGGGSGGWSALENTAKRFEDDMRRQREQMRAAAEELAAPFRSEAGQIALNILIQSTLLRPLVKPIEGYTLEQQALYSMVREGQNQIVTMICNALATANGQASKEGGVT